MSESTNQPQITLFDLLALLGEDKTKKPVLFDGDETTPGVRMMCVLPEATDEEILAFANEKRPSETGLMFDTVEREPNEPCPHREERIHITIRVSNVEHHEP